MIKGIFSIRDIKAGFNDPFVAVNAKVAKRSFELLQRDKSTTIGAYPEDYELWQLATIDTETGEITPAKGVI